MLFTFFVIMLVMVSISVHELGHAFAMRECGVRVERISLIGVPGLGTFRIPVRLSQFPGTEWVIHPFVIGAYVMANEDDMEKASARDRVFISAAGPLANIAFAFVLAGCATAAVLTEVLSGSLLGAVVGALVLCGPLFAVGWLAWRFRRFLARYAVPCIVVLALALFLRGIRSSVLTPYGTSDFVRDIHVHSQAVQGSTEGFGLYFALAIGAILSAGLGILNLIPLIPLDGGQIVREYLPARWKDAYSLLTFPIVAIMLLMSLGKDAWNFAHLFF